MRLKLEIEDSRKYILFSIDEHAEPRGHIHEGELGSKRRNDSSIFSQMKRFKLESDKHRVFPGEWYPQSMVQLTWPHSQTDWAPILQEARTCFAAIGREIAKQQKLLLVCQNPEEVRPYFQHTPPQQLCFAQIPTNDTWARDHAALTVLVEGKPVLLDFGFNGWGQKFDAELDNQISKQLKTKGIFAGLFAYEDHQNFILEGGSIESDGQGTILTTTACLLNPNRNPGRSKEEIEVYLKKALGAKRILWLNHGYLAGDDTDSHIDTLARFCDENTIAYVQCTEPKDEHYEALKEMEKELQSFRKADGKPYRLIPLPMAQAVFENGKRLPATYANFLIINDKILLPYYDTSLDDLAKAQLQKAFPDRAIIGIDCTTLIKQHGSLHCVTMQYPKSIL